jgi:hypothetical protein
MVGVSVISTDTLGYKMPRLFSLADAFNQISIAPRSRKAQLESRASYMLPVTKIKLAQNITRL